MKDKVSTKELFILGVISREPIHGHGINRIIEISGAEHWVELSDKHVYYVLRKLEGGGLITSHREQVAGAPPRTVFAITDEGRNRLRDWLQATALIESLPPAPFDAVFGMLGFADALDEDETLAVLRLRRTALEASLGHYDPAHVSELRRRYGATAAHMLLKTNALLSAEMEWIDSVIAEIETVGWSGFRVPRENL